MGAALSKPPELGQSPDAATYVLETLGCSRPGTGLKACLEFLAQVCEAEGRIL